MTSLTCALVTRQVLWVTEPGTAVVVTGDGMNDALPHSWLHAGVQEHLAPRTRAGRIGQGVFAFLRQCEDRMRTIVKSDPHAFASWTRHGYAPGPASAAAASAPAATSKKLGPSATSPAAPSSTTRKLVDRVDIAVPAAPATYGCATPSPLLSLAVLTRVRLCTREPTVAGCKMSWGSLTPTSLDRSTASAAACAPHASPTLASSTPCTHATMAATQRTRATYTTATKPLPPLQSRTRHRLR